MKSPILLMVSLSLFLLGLPMIAAAAETFSPTPNVKISYQDSGPRTANAIFLIHGFPLNQKMWASQAEALKKNNRVITYDQRGFGKSKNDEPYTLEILVDDLVALMDHLKLKKATLLGFSMGGYVALRAVEKYPARFNALILSDTQSAADSDESKLKRTLALKQILSNGVRAYGESFLKNAVSEKTKTENPQILKGLLEIISENTQTSVAAGVLALISRTDTTLSLNKITVPTLIVVGEDDAITPVAGAKAMHEQITGSVLQVIPAAGHLLPVERPAPFNEAVLKFLSEVR